MTHFRKHLLATTAVALVLSLAACGGGSDEDDVRSASEDFVSAFKDENWEEVCSLMTEKSRAQLEQAGEALDAKGGCADVWEKAKEFLPPETEKQLDNFEVDTVKVTGDKATVTTTDAKGSPTQLLKEDGEWRINFAS
jgi:ketosteroid isomerase-like protein